MRKKLWIFMVIVFIAATVDTGLPIFNKISKTNTLNKSLTSNNTVSAPTATLEPLFKDYEKERFVAHRGLSDHAPENTMPAFELAGKAGFWGIETDIIETMDGVFMCMHDDELDRTTTGTGYAWDYTYSQLMDFNVDYGNDIEDYPNLKIPTMIEYLNMCVIYNCVPLIEIKKITDYESFLKTIENSGLQDRCIISGGIEDLEAIRRLNSGIPLMVIGYSNRPYTFYTDLITRLPENSGILYDRNSVDQNAVNDIRSKGLLIGVWTLDTDEEAKKYINFGVDFVVTNHIPSLNPMINDKE